MRRLAAARVRVACIAACLFCGCRMHLEEREPVTLGRLASLGELARAALEKGKPIEDLATLDAFLDASAAEAEGDGESLRTDERGRPILYATYHFRGAKGFLFTATGRDLTTDRDDFRVWVCRPDGEKGEIVVERSWDQVPGRR